MYPAAGRDDGRRGLWWAKKRKLRYELIARYLLNPGGHGGDEDPNQIKPAYDFIALQEVWMRKDYELLRARLQPHYTHSVRFPRGVIGSGLAIFSRHPIEHSFYRRFTLNGAPDRFWHGDFYSGKGVGGIRVRVAGVPVDVYTTHLHAEYNRAAQTYLAHRLTQCYELAQFVEGTSRPDHIVLVAGDLNTLPEELPCQMLWSGAANRLERPLVDGWRCVQEREETEACLAASPTASLIGADPVGATFRHPRNTFRKGRGDSKRTEQRIDYVLFAPRPGLRCDEVCVFGEDDTFDPRGVSFSDHSLLNATFTLDLAAFRRGPPTDPDEPPTTQKEEGEETAIIADGNNGNDGNLLAIRRPPSPSSQIALQREIYQKALLTLEEKKRHVRNWQIFYTIVVVIMLIGFVAITITTAITIPGDQLTPLLTLALFGVQPALLVTAFTSLFMARLFLQEELAALEHFEGEWRLWLYQHECLSPSAATIIEIS